MKVKIIEKAFYNLEFLKEGQVIDFKGKELPSWATLADGIETQKGKSGKTPKEPKAPEAPQTTLPETDVNNNEEKTETKDENETGDAPDTNSNLPVEQSAPEAPQDTTVSDTKKQEYLELLINEGIEKGILIEDADKKTVDEQIKELETALNK